MEKQKIEIQIKLLEKIDKYIKFLIDSAKNFSIEELLYPKTSYKKPETMNEDIWLGFKNIKNIDAWIYRNMDCYKGIQTIHLKHEKPYAFYQFIWLLAHNEKKYKLIDAWANFVYYCEEHKKEDITSGIFIGQIRKFMYETLIEKGVKECDLLKVEKTMKELKRKHLEEGLDYKVLHRRWIG